MHASVLSSQETGIALSENNYIQKCKLNAKCIHTYSSYQNRLLSLAL